MHHTLLQRAGATQAVSRQGVIPSGWFAIAFPALFVRALSFYMPSVKQGAAARSTIKAFGTTRPGFEPPTSQTRSEPFHRRV